jgi:hypothetical protein
LSRLACIHKITIGDSELINARLGPDFVAEVGDFSREETG